MIHALFRVTGISSMRDPRSAIVAVVTVVALFTSFSRYAIARDDRDRLRNLQMDYVINVGRKMPRVYHFGSQGPGDVFSNHTSHTNRLIPVYVFGQKADLSAVTGANSRYRDPQKIKDLYGVLPAHTVNPQAVYADQSDMFRVQKEAVSRGVKHLSVSSGFSARPANAEVSRYAIMNYALSY